MRWLPMIVLFTLALAPTAWAQTPTPTKNPCLEPIVIQRGPATASLTVFLGSDEVDFRTKVSTVHFKFHLHNSNEPHGYSSAPASFGVTGFANCVSMIIPLPVDKIQRDGTVYDVYVQFENTSRMVSGWTADPLPFALGGTTPIPDPTPKPPRVPTARLGVS